MQMNQITRYFTPARFIRTIDATYDGGLVFHMDADISLSTDPAITFGFVPGKKGQMKVVALDSNNSSFDRTFEVPATPAT
jgi:sulfur-oxidizing protein SoxY